MSATISASGDWTGLTGLDTTAAAKTKANVPDFEDLNLESLKTTIGEGSELPELTQFITLLSDGYNIGYWHAAALLSKFLRMHFQSQTVPNLMRKYP